MHRIKLSELVFRKFPRDFNIVYVISVHNSSLEVADSLSWFTTCMFWFCVAFFFHFDPERKLIGTANFVKIISA